MRITALCINKLCFEVHRSNILRKETAHQLDMIGTMRGYRETKQLEVVYSIYSNSIGRE